MSATTTVQPDPEGPAPGRPPRRRADVVRLVARGVGQTFITAGLVILLFVVYEVWVTNISAGQQQQAVHQRFEQALEHPTVGSSQLPLPGASQATVPAGQGIANIYIPRLGKDYVFTVVEGTNDADLDKGPGHYHGTAMPGQPGNFSVAGHRVGKGEPFLNLDQLLPGDDVVVQVPGTWYVYQVLGSGGDLSVPDAHGVPGREIVSPSDVAVINPTPDAPGALVNGNYMTMTTCHPKYSASQRMIVHATLTGSKTAQGDALPTELGGSL